MDNQNNCVESKYCEILIAAYHHTQSEITRYRDREWAVPGIFIAAMVTTIGFIIKNSDEIINYHFVLNAFLFILACSNTYFCCFTHDRLTEQRIIRNDIEYKLKIQEYSVEDKLIFKDYKIQHPNKIEYHSEWLKGYRDHILPFIISGWILYLAGIWILSDI